MFKIGMTLMAFGMMTADSDSLIIPTLMLLLGMAMVLKGAKE